MLIRSLSLSPPLLQHTCVPHWPPQSAPYPRELEHSWQELIRIEHFCCVLHYYHCSYILHYSHASLLSANHISLTLLSWQYWSVAELECLNCNSNELFLKVEFLESCTSKTVDVTLFSMLLQSSSILTEMELSSSPIIGLIDPIDDCQFFNFNPLGLTGSLE